MRFYLTFFLVILLMSGCVNTRSLASRSNSRCGMMGAGDALGHSIAMDAEANSNTAVTNLDFSDYN